MRTVNTRLTPSPIGPRGKPIITLTLLKDFADGFQTSYPFSLPVQRSMDYFIVLERDYKPPARCIYRLAPSELAELKTVRSGSTTLNIIKNRTSTTTQDPKPITIFGFSVRIALHSQFGSFRSGSCPSNSATPE